ncbi:hypothetical protein AC1031_012263 [Aphanomyces cochlioides]|nr:hypothetical protein AC1031_012263 [Aphanomyces cochlioides]
MARSKRQTYTIEVKREVIALLEDHSDYEVSKLMNIPRRTIRGIAAMKFEVMAHQGNRLNKKITNAKREIFLDPERFVAFMTKMRNEEKALSCVHNINWIKKHHHSWLLDYLSTKSPETAYQSLLRLLQRFCDSYGFSRQRPVFAKKT